MVAKTERFEMRLDEGTVARIDEWRSTHPDIPSRAEAIRRLVEIALAGREESSTRFSDGEKLLLLMMKDLFKHLKLKDADTDPEFIAKVIYGGHYWAPKWRMTGVFHGHEDNPVRLNQVLNVLDMWDDVERGYERLSKKEKQLLAAAVPVFGEHVKFRGFDGNTEAEYIGMADFFINELGRFSRFAKRELNAHLPMLEAYERMLNVYTPLRPSMGGELGYAAIEAILKAMPYPR